MSWKAKGLQYLSQRTGGIRDESSKQSWREWAGNKLKLVRGAGMPDALSEERIALFPGWATRRYIKSDIEGAFSVDLFVSGYASTHRPPEFATRSQRTFIRLAKSFAALPTLAVQGPDPSSSSASLSRNIPSTPPRLDGTAEEVEIEALEQQFQKANRLSLAEGDLGGVPPDLTTSAIHPSSALFDEDDSRPPSPSSMVDQALSRLHMNLERRLQPFWSSVVTARPVQLHLFATHSSAERYRVGLQRQIHPDDHTNQDDLPEPVSSQTLLTDGDGSFQALFHLNWERLCCHPEALHIAYGDFEPGQNHEHEFYVVAELMPAPPPPTPNVSYATYEPLAHRNRASHTNNLPSVKNRPVAVQGIPLTYSSIRVLSDIDDTVKVANVLSGARSIFHTVFVKDLSENIIPGMAQWYSELWQQGVRFHYVSNGPFEILPVVQEFFKKAGLPPGSIKLRSYAGKSLFSGLLTAPAARKRSNVLEILNAFPDSKFALIGDSGEQDLELYVEVATQKADQVMAIFIRDVEPDSASIPDPTGNLALVNPSLSSLDQGQSSQAPAPSYYSPLLDNGSPGVRSRSYPTSPSTNTSERYPRSPPPQEPFISSMPLTDEPNPMPSMKAPLSQGSRWSSSTRSPSLTELQSSPFPPSPYAPNPSMSPPPSSRRPDGVPLTEAERRRNELQNRVWRARTILPKSIPFRIFQHPTECVEMGTLMQAD